jgi:transcription antitermination factor NusG
MATVARAIDSAEQWQALTQPHWYALYTCANHEKRVAAELTQRSVENFLPLYSSVRRWKDRRVKLDLPLFPGYVFVRMALAEKLKVVQVPSAVRLVGFGGLPVALPELEMQIVREGLSGGVRAEPHPFLRVGHRVRITGGPFAGLEGILKQRKSGLRVVVSLELIQRSVAVEVEAADVRALPGGGPPSLSGVFRKNGTPLPKTTIGNS